jgi:hypothetical protein
MKKVSTVAARKVRVVSNGARKGDKWARIVVDGKVAHVGQLPYIKRLAIGKYNTLPNL